MTFRRALLKATGDVAFATGMTIVFGVIAVGLTATIVPRAVVKWGRR